MSNQEIIDHLVKEQIIYPVYKDGDVEWIVEVRSGGKRIGDEGFTWDEICELYREQTLFYL